MSKHKKCVYSIDGRTKTHKITFTGESWQTPRKILQKYDGSQALPDNLKEFLNQHRQLTGELNELAVDARENGNDASYRILAIF